FIYLLCKIYGAFLLVKAYLRQIFYYNSVLNYANIICARKMLLMAETIMFSAILLALKKKIIDYEQLFFEGNSI
ncbi:MAG: hypothetical protein K2P12_05560, partial [Clostridia bacterium]|nr:hypothetical protein [Clostridia bacterium]